MLGLQLSKPFHLTSEWLTHAFSTPVRPGEFGNCSSKELEIFRRTIQVMMAVSFYPLSLSSWFFGGIVDQVESLFEAKPYRVLKGKGEEKLFSNGSLTLLNLNACMLWGGLPILFGGVRPASERIERLSSKILLDWGSPDIVVMEEVSYGAALALWQELKQVYAHGFTRISPMPWLMLDTGLFIAFKFPIVGTPVLHILPSNGTIKRGVFILETLTCFIFATHLEAGDKEEDCSMRKKQLQEIFALVNDVKERSSKPCLLVGDLNIKREGIAFNEYTSSGILEHFDDFYQPGIFNEATATCTNLLTAKATGKELVGSSWELIDYILQAKGSQERLSLDVQLLPTYEGSESLSDHRGLLARKL